MSRLVSRLAGREAALIDDLDRLLAMRVDDAPARPELGLPPLPPWLPDHDARRRLQEAIAATVRAGEPRLAEVRVAAEAASDEAVFTIHARLHDGSALGTEARLRRGRLKVVP